MKKIWYNWKKPVKVISIISICLALVLLAGCFVNAFVDIENGKLSSDIGDKLGSAVGISKTRNSQNLLDPVSMSVIEGVQNGVTVTVNDDGSITLDGKATAKANLRIFTLPGSDSQGLTLTIGGVDFGNDAKNTSLLWRRVEGNDVKAYNVYSGKSLTYTCQCTDSVSYVLYLSIIAGDSFDNVTIYPTLNYGYVAQPFYEEKESFSDNFSDFIGAEKVRNASNLLDPEVYEEIADEYDKLNVTVNDDGSITLDGKATSDISLELGSFTDMTLACVKLTVGRVDFGEDAPGTHLKWGYDGEATYPEEVFDIPVGYDYPLAPFAEGLASGVGSFHLTVEISSGDRFDNVTIYPVLNYGVTAVSYFE